MWIVFSIIIMLFLSLSPRAYAVNANAFETYGDIGQIALPIIALAMTAIHNDREGTIQLAKAFSATMGTTFALKHAIDARRPNGGGESFPSGHTSAAFAGAGFIQYRYGWKYGLPAYAAATLVGISRVTSNHHHIQDVIASAIIAISANHIFTQRFEEKNLTITPINLDEGVGVIITYRW